MANRPRPIYRTPMRMTRDPRLVRFLASLALFALVGPAAPAAPRDDTLRVAPPNAALVMVVQNARDHTQNILNSPFAGWFPSSAVGKQLAATAPLQLREIAAPLFATIGVTPEALLADVFGDAVVFAYTPPTTDNPGGERAVLLVRPRKPETLAKLIDRLNEIQIASGEVKAIARREHKGGEYFERQKTGGGSEFYCFRGGVFAYSGTEPDIKAVIDQDMTAPPINVQPSGLAGKIEKLGVSTAFVTLLVNPRALDAEVRAKVVAAKPDEKPFLNRFAEVWGALDAAAIYLTVDKNLEAGISLDFRPNALPVASSGYLTGERTASGLWPAVPETALVAAAARFRAGVLLGAVGSILPEAGKKSLESVIADTIGPVIGRNHMPQVLDSLGPDWVAWAEPPTGDGHLPLFVGVVRISPEGGKGKETSRRIARAVGFGFQVARVAYNSSHVDQIEIEEEEDGDAIITTLVNGTTFPPGFRPAFAAKGGCLVVAGAPEAIRRFRTPTGVPAVTEEVVAVRFSGAATRAYILAHREQLVGFLAKAGSGPEKEILKHLDQFATVLEPIERVELLSRGSKTGVRLAIRVQFVKPLK